jgi:hypothetical protein
VIRIRSLSWLLGVVWIVLASRPVSAISPAFILVYGGTLEKPVLIQLSQETMAAGQMFWWRGPWDFKQTMKGNALTPALMNRPYYKVAIFWGQYLEGQLTPENASQHGRLYLPTEKDSAVMVATAPDMEPVARPIPLDLEGFTSAWTLTPGDLATASGLGVPGLVSGR